jgi:hypothetical protein
MDRPGLLIVRASIVQNKRNEYNRWYNEVHLPWALANLEGAVGARRYEYVTGDDDTAEQFPLITVYNFQSERQVVAALASDTVRQGMAEYNARFGAFSDRVKAGYRQIHP